MGFVGAEFTTSQVLWSLVWMILMVACIAVLVSAGISVWRYVGRSNTGASHVVLTMLGIGGMAILMILPFIGLPVAIAVVFFERTSAPTVQAARAEPPERVDEL